MGEAKDTDGARATEAYELEKLQKEIWEKAIDTQMHFNEMSVRSRQLGLSFVVAALGVVAVLLSKDDARISGWGYSTHVAGPILILAAFGLYSVKRLDLGVYHRMLRGAVAFNEDLELSSMRPNLMKTKLGLTQAISLYSRYPDADYPGKGPKRQSAETRVQIFYWSTIAVLISLGVLISWSRRTTPATPTASKAATGSTSPDAATQTGGTPQTK